jgi:hypothetical protein
MGFLIVKQLCGMHPKFPCYGIVVPLGRRSSAITVAFSQFEGGVAA